MKLSSHYFYYSYFKSLLSHLNVKFQQFNFFQASFVCLHLWEFSTTSTVSFWLICVNTLLCFLFPCLLSFSPFHKQLNTYYSVHCGNPKDSMTN